MSDGTSKSIGVYICTEEGEVEKLIDLDELEEMLLEQEGVTDVFFHHSICSKEGKELVLERYKKSRPDGVLLIGSKPSVGNRIRDLMVAEGLNKYLFEQINLKELCLSIHKDREVAIKKAKSLLLGGIARLLSARPLEDIKMPIKQEVLVIGGGVAGMASAIEIADAGYKVYLVEREKELGGRTYRLTTTFPTHECGICCMRYCKECVLTPNIPEVYAHSDIEVFTNSEVKEITGYFGNRHVVIDHGGEEREVDVGAIVVTTGSKTFDPRNLPEYRYDEFDDVITSMEFVDIMERSPKEGFRRPSDGQVPKTVNFILCVGSRDKNKANHYCSIVCCTYAIGSAKEMKLAHPDTEVYVHYIDLRGPYRGFETLLDEAREAGVVFVRGRLAEVTGEGDNIILRTEDTDLGKIMEIESDLVVLAVGQEPNEGSEDIMRMTRLQADVDGFMKDFNPMFPEEIKKGIYVAGCAQGPRGIRYSIDDATRVANEVIALLDKKDIFVENVMAEVDEETCRGCGRCVENCPFDAITLIEKDGREVASVAENVCEGCGICSVVCCNKSMNMRHYSRGGIISQVRSVVKEVG